MVIKNAHIFTGDAFLHADVRCTDTIEQIGSFPDESDAIDAQGGYLIPGLVDIHTHGAVGADFSDADPDGLVRMSQFYATQGVTSFVGTTMALPEAELCAMIDAAHAFSPTRGARLLGIHMEGPFINPDRCGAHAAQYIRSADVALFLRMQERAKGRILIADTAPELAGATQFIEAAKGTCRVSLGHTTCSYEQARAGFAAGATHVTHLFNAMPPFLHRDPGLVGAARDCGAFVEVICDGIHLHESMIRAVFAMFPKDRVCFISDSMRATGLADGAYTLGGQAVTVRAGKATLANGTIAGSCISLLQALQNAVRFGVPLVDAVRAVTATPLMALGREYPLGRIAPGYLADLVLLNEHLELKQVWIEGESIL